MIAKRPFAKFVFVQIEELLSTQALGYFLHNLPRPPQTPAGFLQVSFSKILGDRDPAFTSTWLASDFR
jgi:hypothetical protein